MLARLGHGTVVGGDDEDGAVHLGRAGDHVLDVVGVAGAVDVGVVPLGRLVLDVGHGDGDGLQIVALGAALGDLLVNVGGRIVDRLALEGGDLVLDRRAHDQGRRQGGLAMVDVPDGANVDVR